MKVTHKSDVDVELVQAAGTDAHVVMAARASTRGAEAKPEDNYGLIRALAFMGHSSPFEHCFMTVQAHAPAAVWWEWTRHRFQSTEVPNLSFNLESGRYKKLEPIFWMPRPSRGVHPAPDHKPIRPRYVAPTAEDYKVHCKLRMEAHEAAWAAYQDLLNFGVCNEAARGVLGFDVYYSGFVSGNLLSWMHFVSKRTYEATARRPSFPLAEIEEAARQCERIASGLWPLCWKAFNENGREAP